ncbi:serine hydroxymethyltransferase [Mycoplasmopsis californica HAZ160_1]|uniref:Serine hydroxymethyltransferase n=1 Tax=Mycoplasmopsis californica HAZ160_1 TaxID=1397850 RepID=A0AAT9F7T0_9BACT|nr:serine hydroxymethyltransferase [Mycoplasmopsis californica]BAP00936.1 serine hydroxymethyltransferase [Mycoplasmopsis californica HAZ160_1]BBG40798.1 serine hydroxymethyltransferase [Mycoplasmopsis californica]BBG41392.1 serine hydroxymethyltransferase [Mycoplasmopsis californica]BBG41985.1 serine hydroxymethyltransferase [Mycoplasmopsis californica]BBG42571.1 serine hydroxymethyltransferase [Mycoplasmopsis californica]
MYKKIKLIDKDVEKAINKEIKRQNEHIELIASENYVSNDVLKATGSVLTNKYGEGYPGKRYYGGCENVDAIENLAIERLKQLFGVEFANVQPYSGSVANAAALASLAKPGDKIMGLSLNSGGHLTHGYKISFSGIFYKSVSYEVDQNGVLDYEEIKRIAIKEKPVVIICGYSAYPRIVDFKKFREIADACGAKLMADIAHISGLIIAGVHPSPVGYADVITSTTHKTLRGTRGAIIMTNDAEIAKKVDRWVFPGYQGGPLFHAIAGKAVAFGEALKPEFKEYGRSIVANAKMFSEAFINRGVEVVSGKTDNHLFTLNVYKSYGITGKEAEKILGNINITVNKNTIPNDSLNPMVSSGIRIGTAAMTSRKFTKWEQLAEIIHTLLSNFMVIKKDKTLLKELKQKVKDLSAQFPIITEY